MRRLRILLGQPYNFDRCLEIITETAALYREPTRFRWYFLLLNRIFGSLIDNPELHDPEQTGPILEFIYEHSCDGLDAVESGDTERLVSTANQLTEGYLAIP